MVLPYGVRQGLEAAQYTAQFASQVGSRGAHTSLLECSYIMYSSR
jgi:hypothetical protein